MHVGARNAPLNDMAIGQLVEEHRGVAAGADRHRRDDDGGKCAFVRIVDSDEHDVARA
jgi:hypothetical protein